MHLSPPPPPQDFLHDFQDATGLLPRAEEQPSAAAGTASGAASGDATTAAERRWVGAGRGGDYRM